MLTLYYLMKNSKKEKPKLNATEYYKTIHENNDRHFKRAMEDKEGSLYKCRVCLQEGSMPIFGTVDTVYIIETLAILSNIELREDDEYPNFLCDICHEFIKGAILFRKIARQSDAILKQSGKEETVDEHEEYDQDFSESKEETVDEHEEYDQDFSESKEETVDEREEYDQDFSESCVYDTKQPEKWEIENEDLGEVKLQKKPKLNYAPKVTCNICNKVVNRAYYKQHMTMHDPDHKKYVCDVCGKSFRLRCAYYTHSLKHGNEFPYKCQFCPYKGKYSGLLKTHMKTHTGDYRYMCTECPAKFLFKSNLNSHALKHKEPQFQCDACERAFHTKRMLRMHYEADHLGIKDHVCNICGKAFGYRNAMMQHQRLVHKRKKQLFGRMPAYLEAEHRNEDGR